MWAGERPPKTLVDPGFVISRDTLDEKRDTMWGYGAWKAKTTSAAAKSRGAAAGCGCRGFCGRIRGWRRRPRWRRMGAVHRRPARFLAGDVFHATLARRAARDAAARDSGGGQMLVLLIGQIDLSMTAVMATGSVVSASVMTRHVADWWRAGSRR